MLKNLNKLEVSVEPHLVNRVRKAIIKEKNIDLGFKILNEMERFRLCTSYCEKKKVLSLELVAKFGIADKVV